VALLGIAVFVAAVAPAPFSLDCLLAGHSQEVPWDDAVALAVCSTLGLLGLDVVRQTLAIRRLAAGRRGGT
jgi:hypothetical protein